VAGVVLNNVRPETGPDYFKYQSQYYRQREVGGETRAWGMTPLQMDGGKRPGRWGRRLLALLLLSVLALLAYNRRDELAALLQIYRH
jgi:hypothetical protein